MPSEPHINSADISGRLNSNTEASTSILVNSNNQTGAVLNIYEFRAAAGKMYPAIVEDPDYHRSQYWWDPSIVHSPESARFTVLGNSNEPNVLRRC
jgi:hypothetical protein